MSSNDEAQRSVYDVMRGQMDPYDRDCFVYSFPRALPMLVDPTALANLHWDHVSHPPHDVGVARALLTTFFTDRVHCHHSLQWWEHPTKTRAAENQKPSGAALELRDVYVVWE